MSCHLAVDLGAGSGRAFLGRVGAGCLALEEVHRFHYHPRQAAGRLRWDVGRLFDGVRFALAAAPRGASAQGTRLDSVGVDSWGVDYGLLDEDGVLLEEPVCYRDRRTDGVVEEVLRVVPRERVFATTGIQLMQLNTLFQLVAHARDGLPSRASRLLLIPDLCHHLLCGSSSSERTDASTTQLLNATIGEWDDALFHRLGLPRHLMPELVPTGTDLGSLRPALARLPGLEGVRVIAPATHDTASAVAATPLGRGKAFISSGTWSLVGVERAGALLTDAAARENFTNEAGALGTVCLLKNVAGLWLLESCRREWEAGGAEVHLSSLLSAAGGVQGFAGFVFPDAARFFNPASMVREIRTSLAETRQEAPDDPVLLTKVILDSLALRYASVIDTIERLTGDPIHSIHVVGGGSLNTYLNRATSSATGRIVYAGPAEATAAGNVLLQAIAIGELRSLSEGRALVASTHPPERFAPRDERLWEEARKRYDEIARAES